MVQLIIWLNTYTNITNRPHLSARLLLIGNPNPQGNSTANSARMYKLSTGTQKTGLGITLKVMSGDKVNAYGKSYYAAQASGYTTTSNTTAEILGGFIGALNNRGLNGKGATATQINTGINGNISTFFNSQPVGTGSNPKAGICWILFDEQLNYVNAGFSRVKTNGGLKDHFNELQNINISKSGYLYIYCSNESSLSVYFDNLQLTHVHGPLLEETGYYPWGLDMKMLGSKAFGKLENKTKYNGYEKNETFDLNLYESFYRMHDPQLGRFWQIDPKPTDFESLYAAMGNNPVLKYDLLGDTVIVGNQNTQGTILADQNRVYGNNSNYFHFDQDNNLQFTDAGERAFRGSVAANVATGGKIEKINALANSLAGMARLINSTENTAIVYSNDQLNFQGVDASTGRTVNGVKPTDMGGEITLNRTENPTGVNIGGRTFQNIIYINPDAQTTSLTPLWNLRNDLSQMELIQAVPNGGISVTNQRHNLLMHGIGHVAFQNPNTLGNVLRYDNYNRTLSGDAQNRDLDGSHQNHN
jgi:RHS repeat-associated protein